MEVCISSVKKPLSPELRAKAGTPKEGEVVVRRRRALKRVDRELEKGNFKAALSLVKQLKAHPAGLLSGFGAAAAAAKVPRHALPMNELKLSGKTEISSVQLVVDAILQSIKCSLEVQLQEEETDVSLQDFGISKDAKSNGSIDEDHLMCVQHEAGHFLVGYMMGVLPRRYKVPSVEDMLHDPFARGKVEFIGFESLRDVGVDTILDKNFLKWRRNKETLRKFSSVVLGGLAAEHMLFGYSELLHSDVQKLFTLLKCLGLTEKESNCETKRAAEAAVLILYNQSEAQSRLAEAMALGKSVGFCINMIETTLNFKLSSSIV